MTPRAQAEAEARRRREALALRENLHRRKAQSRERKDTPMTSEQAPRHPEALVKTDD